MLSSVQEVMLDEDTPSDISLTDLLERADVGQQEYMQALRVSQRATNIILERTPSEQNVNAYNPTILKAWRANIDIQFIIDAYACVMYVASYMTKDEKGMGELLKQTCKEHRDKDIKTMLRKVGAAFLTHREISAQEAAYRILSMPMKKTSRKVVFVNTDVKSSRPAVLKNNEQLAGLDDNDEDIFQKSLLDRYEYRPNSLENMCLAEFASLYTTDYNEKDKDIDDSVPVVLEEEEINQDTLPKNIKLKNGKGLMHKRNRPAVIRFRKLSVEKEPSNFYRAKLMLYCPWRNEETDLLNGFHDYKSHYDSIAQQMREMENNYTQNAETIDQAIEDNAQNGPPQHMWDVLAPGAEHANLQDQNEAINIERQIEQEDIEANAELFQQASSDSNSSDLISRYELEENREILSHSDYRKMMRCLNAKQRQVVSYHRKWCKRAIQALKEGKKPTPYRLFLSGPGGVGKSHVIKLIHSDTRKIFSLSRRFKPTDITTLLTAPTGVAAFNIGGMTVHSALLLRTSKYGKDGEPLTCEKLNSLRSKLENLQLLIIDEVSMVGSDMLLNIHRRLSEIMGPCDDDALFGNVSVLAVGDLYQLPPVLQSHIYGSVRNPLANLHGNLWKDHFKIHELDEIMRQKNDKQFAEILCRIRIGEHTADDIQTLQTRVIDKTDSSYPYDALHVFAYNQDVDNWNEKMLNQVEPNEENHVVIGAIDDKKDSTGLIDLQKGGHSSKRSQTGGLHTSLVLALGARVMLTYNVDVSDGLVNGVLGTVKGIKKNSSGRVMTVLVNFDNPVVGKTAIASSQWKASYSDCVPIMRHEGKFEKFGKKGAQVSRFQFPLTLAWAVTIHKCQGLTLDKIVVSMKGGKRFGHGQAYVAFSRVRSLDDLFITDFEEKGIKYNKIVANEMEEMETLESEETSKTSHSLEITVGHLNVHYFLEKQNDMQTNTEHMMYHGADIMCFTETYLTEDHWIDTFLNEHSYKAFRTDVPHTDDHNGMHGVMICVSSKMNPVELDLLAVHDLESKVVLTETPRGRLVVVCVYRSPSSSMKSFMQKLESFLMLLPLNVPTVILGDFNDDLLNKLETPLTKFMIQYGFQQHVLEPTTDSGTIVDHVYVNKLPAGYSDVNITVNDIYYSDHDAVFARIK